MKDFNVDIFKKNHAKQYVKLLDCMDKFKLQFNESATKTKFQLGHGEMSINLL
jgi:hypothetical protein